MTVKAPRASIVITSFNRVAEVEVAVASCFAQRGIELEVLVYDDCSEDGTVEMLRSRWPDCRVYEAPARTGYIVNRNRGFKDARSEIVFSLDDDAYFSSTDTVMRAVQIMDQDPAIGALALPYLEPLNRRSRSSLGSPFKEQAGTELKSYVGCAHAIRRQLALRLNGYRDYFVHQGEERDLCIRLRAAGFRVVYADTAPIIHMVSPKRDAGRISYYGARNQILYEVLNAPFPDVCWRIVAASAGIVRHRFRIGDLSMKLRAIGSALATAWKRSADRRPVTISLYREHRGLPTHGAMDWDGPVPQPCGSTGTVP